MQEPAPHFADPSGARRPPNAEEIERRILGGMMLDREATTRVVELLRPDQFYRKGHQLIYQAVVQLFEDGEAIDYATVAEELSRMKKLDEAGGAAYIGQLTADTSSAANIATYAKIVIEKAALRELIGVANHIAANAHEGTDGAFEILDDAESAIFELASKNMRKSYRPIADAARDTMEYIEAIHNEDFRKFAVQSGYYDLDDLLGGFQRSDFVILAARPSMGKTALGLSVARNAAFAGTTVAFFSLEMSEKQLLMRLICAEGKLDAHQVRTGRFPKEKGRLIAKAVAKISEAPMYIDDDPTLSILELRAKARRLKAEEDVGLIVIDYLQLIKGLPNPESREREISHISRSLKALAKELDIPVLALAQLKRDVVDRTDKRPLLSDLRESGSMEQDADVVLLIHRPEYYGVTVDKEGNSLEGVAEIIVAKHRNGPTGDVKLKFVKKYARFENLDKFDRELPPKKTNAQLPEPEPEEENPF
ncbi:MAG: replicative DNA helicase [Ignavibacteriales bacterium]|nr:replicative DNA helicase [Ignavibacteriales bacterium]